MRVERSVITEAGASPGRLRLEATVRYDHGRPGVEDLWFEVPATARDALDGSGNPWVAALLPLAATLGEPLRTDLPVDAPLLAGAREVLRAWRAWHGATHVVPVEAPDRPRPAAPPSRRTLAFFSLGVDSFFTALGGRDRDREAARGAVDDLVFVRGFDRRPRHEVAIDRATAAAVAAARALERPLVVVSTNLRATRWSEANWALLAHGPGLAAIALALGRRHDLALLPGSVWLGDLVPWGSHPLTDGWLSSWDLRVRQDGNETDRFDKVAAIAPDPVARRHLRVCYESEDGGNCGRCAKCTITMAMLDACGALGETATFPGRETLLERLAATKARLPSDRRHLGRTLEAARARGRHDLARALEAALAGSAGTVPPGLRRDARSRRRRWFALRRDPAAERPLAPGDPGA